MAYIANVAHPNVIPSAESVIDAHRRGYIQDRQAAILCSMNGARYLPALQPDPLADAAPQDNPIIQAELSAWRNVADAAQMRFSPQEILVCLNRDIFNDAQAHDELLKNGMTERGVRLAFMELRFEIPGASDLISFALREAWDELTVGRFQYDDEFPREFQFWMERQGFGGDARTPGQIAAGAAPVTWPNLYWRVHWQNVSPTQAYEMFQRLRPERLHIYRETIPDVRAFTQNDLEQVLKINDYAPPFRDQLAAIAYNKPRLLDLQRFYDRGLINQAELYEQHLDYGYSPSLARLRTSYVVQTSAEKGWKKLGLNPQRSIVKMYCTGYMNRRDAELALYKYQIMQAPARQDFLRLPLAAQMNIAHADALTQAVLDQADIDCDLARNDARLKRIKRRYQRGQWDRDRAEKELRSLGMIGSKVNTILFDWDDELSAGKLMLSTAKIRSLVVEGLLPFPLAAQWLFNLGWRDPELSYLLAEVQRDVQLEFAKMQEKNAKNLKAAQLAIAKQMKEAEKIKEQAYKKLLTTLTPARAARYYARGIFSEAQLREVLGMNGFTGTALEAAVKDAKVDKQAYLDKIAKAKAAAEKANAAETGSTNGKAKTGQTS